MISRYDYDAYGNLLTAVPTVDIPYRFVGGLGVRWDVDLGLHYMRNRWYDPSLGRFLSKDPIGYAGGSNLYSYCGGDPINFSDPSGLDEEGPEDCPNEILYREMKARSDRYWQKHMSDWNKKYQQGLELAKKFVASERPDLASYYEAAASAHGEPGSFLLDLVGAQMRTSFDTSTIYVSPETMNNMFTPEFIAKNLLHEGNHIKRGFVWNTLHPFQKEAEAYKIINGEVEKQLENFADTFRKRFTKLR